MVGIYKIENTENGKVYVGQSVTIERRFTSHRTALRGDYHNNSKLQEDFNKFGEDAFLFEILEEVKIKTDEDLWARETYWCKFYNSVQEGYNQVSPQRCFSLAYSEEMVVEIRKKYANGDCTQKELADEHELHYATINQIVTGTIYTHYGGPITKGGNGKPISTSGALTEEDVIEIKKLLKEGGDEYKIAEMFKVHRQTIFNIKYGTHWSHIEGRVWKKPKTRSSEHITDETILLVRNFYNPEINTYEDVANEFNIPLNYVRDIVRGLLKKDIGGKTYTVKEIREGVRKRLNRLDKNDVSKIKTLLNKTEMTYKELADKFNVSAATIGNIKLEKYHKKVKPFIES